MDVGLRGNRAPQRSQVLRSGRHSLLPGFEYIVVEAASLWLPRNVGNGGAVVVHNATNAAITVSADGNQISGIGAADSAWTDTAACILPGERAVFIRDQWMWRSQGAQQNPITASWTYTGSVQSYSLPNWTGALFEAWIRGAGGSGSDQSIGGGSGACYLRLNLAATTNLALGQIAVGALLQVVIGRGGQYGATTSNIFGGGRAGQSTGGQGGDYSGLFLGSVSQANAVGLAGGGGGACGGGTGRNGGAGGGATGASGSGTGPGTGGSQSAGGSDGGGALTGGGGNPAGVGGGGGSGYNGGGATTGAGGAGGGAGFLPSGALSGSTLTTGSGQSPAALTGAPSNTGTGGNAASNGQNGWIQITITP